MAARRNKPAASRLFYVVAIGFPVAVLVFHALLFFRFATGAPEMPFLEGPDVPTNVRNGLGLAILAAIGLAFPFALAVDRFKKRKLSPESCALEARFPRLQKLRRASFVMVPIYVGIAGVVAWALRDRGLEMFGAFRGNLGFAWIGALAGLIAFWIVLTALTTRWVFPRFRRERERTVPLGISESQEWLESARRRALECGFTPVSEEAVRLEFDFSRGLKDSLLIELRPSGPDIVGTVRHAIHAKILFDTGEGPYSENVVAYVAGETSIVPRFRTMSLGALMGFTAVWFPLLALAATAVHFDRTVAVLACTTSVFTIVSCMVAGIEVLMGDFGKRLAAAAFIMGASSTFAANLPLVRAFPKMYGDPAEQVRGRADAERDWNAGKSAWKGIGLMMSFTDVSQEDGIPVEGLG